jgi:hypothetical protein
MKLIVQEKNAIMSYAVLNLARAQKILIPGK